MEFFKAEKVTDRIYRISGIITEYMYLVVGTDQALLIDTGCGAGDIHAFVRTLTDLPLTVVLTHGHYDHAGGAGRFPEVWLDSRELEPTPIHYLKNATYEKLKSGHPTLRLEDMTPDAGETATKDPSGAAICTTSVPVTFRPLTPGKLFALGGITAEAIPCPGHTPGTYCILLVEERLLLTGDACHSISYLFFDNALTIEEYRQNLIALNRQKDRWDSLLLSHPIATAPKTMIDEVIHLCDQILAGTTDEIPWPWQDKPVYIAKAIDDRMLRQDGVYGNIIFRKDKLRKHM